MTFHARLSELIEKATKGEWVVNSGNITTTPHYSRWGAGLHEAGVVNKLVCVQTPDADLIVFLVNHAEAIRDLVVAAEQMINGNGSDEVMHEMGKALAKLGEV